MDLKIGDKLVCIVNNDELFAPCEVVEIEDVISGGELVVYKFKGYRRLFSKGSIEKIFVKY